MCSCRRSSILLRLGATLAFLSYLSAGAGFLLPASAAGVRCPHANKSSTIKPDFSRPLSVHKHHCPHSEGQQATSKSKIILCPDGCCLLHPGQGVVTSTAKFVSPHSSALVIRLAASLIAEEVYYPPQQLSFPPPQHPPPIAI
jgi:hypothetical protein